MTTNGGKPRVSVVLPVYNEAKFLDKTIRSLLDQEMRNFELEILVVDGQSTDNSRELVARMASNDPRVRLLVNEQRRTPFALNIGLREASGDFIGILGAHNEYEDKYISICLEELTNRGAAACSGRVITHPANEKLPARLVAWTLSHPFGSSNKSFRTQKEGFVDTVPYPIARKDALLDVGGYDETLFRNQDNDINQRLRSKGYKLFCTWKTQCFYHPQSTVRGLLSYAYRNGYWNVISLKRNLRSMGLRHFVPFLFVLALGFFLIISLLALFVALPYKALFVSLFPLLVVMHLSFGAVAGIQVALRERSFEPLLLPILFFLLHISYGVGTLTALLHTGQERSNP
jgi:succinoglycan biosynthesis protein ExoA